MKRFIVFLLVVSLLLAVLSGCGGGEKDAAVQSAAEKTDVAAIAAETVGTDVAHQEGYNEGYDEGYSVGYDEGYDAGYADGQAAELAAPEPEAAPAASDPEDAAYEVTYTHSVTYTNSIGTTWMQTIIEITNTGTAPLYLSSGSYDLEDASGALVDSRSMVSAYPDVLGPGEKGYMYEETTLDGVAGGQELTVIPHVDAEAATVEMIRFPVTDVSISDGSYGGVEVLGRVENTSTEEQSMVYIACVFYDANGLPLGVAFTIVMNDMAAGDKVGFTASTLTAPDTLTASSIADYVIYAYPMQYQF